MVSSLFAAARDCLDAATPDAKLALTFATAEAFAAGELDIPDDAPSPELLVEYARAVLHGPFNLQARSEAGFDDEELAMLHTLAKP